jgi:hypothetical protein
MKKILVFLITFLVCSCASKPTVETEKCDAIMNRGSACVCGKDRVYNVCTPVPGHENMNVAE